jgi:hypothetical protein
MRKNASRTHLNERLDGARDVCVTALGVARAKADCAEPVLAPPAVIDQRRVRTCEADG